MKGQKKFKNLIREVINLITKFFKPYGIKDEMVSIPKSVMHMGNKVSFIELATTVISMFFAFLLKMSNMMIEHRLILLGIIFFMLYRGEKVISEAFRAFTQSENQKFLLVFEDEIALRGSQIIGLTTNKVLKFDEKNKLYKIMNNESMLNTIKNYLEKLWLQRIGHKFDIFEMISVGIMLIVAIVMNTTIDQVIFIPLIFVFIIISFLSSAYVSLKRNDFYKKNKEYNNEQSIIANDLLRVPIIVRRDLNMRIGKFQKTLVESRRNATRFYRNLNLSALSVSAFEVVSHYGIIIFYLLGVDWNSIGLATITEITATLVIVETALNRVRNIATVLNRNSEHITIMEREEADISLILDVYHTESEKISKSKVIDNISIDPFSIQYLEESENDKPFTLVSKETIDIKKGEIAILYGPSGSGKSTFMKMLTERIRLKKSVGIPATSRFLFYEEEMKFGSLSIYEELFCCDENPNLTKMQEILENLHLWCEIKSNCSDVWKWMTEKKFERSLSKGQKQRLILAKMLYWLDDDIDVMVLDECTSGLDDKSKIDSADAERILEYIVRYVNNDKKRIVIISTHQNIDGLKHNLASEYIFKNLYFSKDGENNLVKEI